MSDISPSPENELRASKFKKCVFINCPFDADYEPMLRAIIFTCLYCNLTPKVANLYDAGESRLLHIIKLIKQSEYCIHDLSRVDLDKYSGLPRFNMPFELGLDIGLKYCDANGNSAERKSLVLDEEFHRVKKVVSDLGGSDFKSYGTRSPTERLIKEVRNWFSGLEAVPRRLLGQTVWLEFNEFTSDFERKLNELNIENSFSEIPVNDYIGLAKDWVSERKAYKNSFDI